jgi:hypothetical protein
MYNLTIDRPASPKGEQFHVHGLGVFENGKTYAIDAELAENFRLVNSTQHSETNADGTMNVWTEKGPTVLQAFQNDPEVTVETVTKKKGNEPSKNEPEEGTAAGGQPEPPADANVDNNEKGAE